eukprot:4380608-Prymnesium_polylepis.2
MPQIFAALRAAVHVAMVGMLWRAITLCPLCVARVRGRPGETCFATFQGSSMGSSVSKPTGTAHHCANSV